MEDDVNLDQQQDDSQREQRREKTREERRAHHKKRAESNHPERKKNSKDDETVKISKSAVFAVLAVIFLGLFLLSLFTNIFGNNGGASSKLSDEEVTSKVVGAIEGIQPGLNPTVSNIKQLPDGTYEFSLIIQGEALTSYLSPSGSMFFPQGFEAKNSVIGTNQPVDLGIQKSDRPTVELYVWGYCPFGVQAQGPLAEVANLLGDNADFIIVPYYDGHGPYETQQNMIQSCIQKLEPEKYWDYASEFVASIYPKCNPTRDAECDEEESVKLMNSLKIDSEAVLECVDAEGTALNAAATQKAQASGVTGSPTLVINGVKVQVARNAEAFKSAVCSAFNNAPAECEGVVLDSTAAAPAGNC